MNIELYRKQRAEFLKKQTQYRNLCTACLQPEFGCYCEHIQKFDPKIKFVILMHPIEMKRRIATGRMAHLCMANSELIVGQNYTNNENVNAILADSKYQPFTLYPGRSSLNLTAATASEKQALFLPQKTPAIFVIDGTWATARKMVRQSTNLHDVPRLHFVPPAQSRFRVRKQPHANCYSTIEAIHHSIELIGNEVGFNLAEQKHENLLNVFDSMVERQLHFIREAYDNPRSTSYRRPKHRVA